MKPRINLGAYGWRHAHWLETFYPADLPEDWQLTYYSNEFNTVLVPADYWQAAADLDCADWLDNVHHGFQFFVECHASMLDYISPAELTGYLKKLRPQLSALVFLDEKQQMSAAVKDQFTALIETIEVDVFGSSFLSGANARNIWRVGNPQSSSFAWIENDLTDLRAARKIIENFVSQSVNDGKITSEAALIVNHPRLQTNDLSKLRSLIEIMGY